MTASELPIAVQIEQTQELLHVHEALCRAMRDPHAVLDMVLEADDAEAARSVLRERLGPNELQATAVLEFAISARNAR
jgi:DNA gyrase/topoisomerase IV subunit A